MPDDVMHAVDRRFLSLTVDTARLAPPLNAPVFDFERGRLLNLCRGLRPAYLHFGGPSADRTYYDLTTRVKPAPRGFDAVLTADRWDAAVAFAQDTGLALSVTLNAGAANRSRSTWRSDQARHLVEHAAARRDPVLVWTFGHAAADRPAFDGVEFPPLQYAEDLQTAAKVIQDHSQGSLLAGSVLGLRSATEALTDACRALDVIRWRHRGHLADGARPTAAELDQVAVEAQAVEAARAAGDASWTPLWLNDTALTAGGGATDPVAAGLWWVDHLATIARRGHAVIARPALSSTPAGLIDELTLEPTPDYWASVLWKRLMGREVLAPELLDDAPDLRVYAHWTPSGGAIPDNAVTVLVVNVGGDAEQLELTGLSCERSLALHVDIDGAAGQAAVNGWRATLDQGERPVVAGHVEQHDPARATLIVRARSYAFFVLAPTGATFGAD